VNATTLCRYLLSLKPKQVHVILCQLTHSPLRSVGSALKTIRILIQNGSQRGVHSVQSSHVVFILILQHIKAAKLNTSMFAQDVSACDAAFMSCCVVPPHFFPRCEEHKRREQNARNAGDPGGAAQQDRGRAGQHQRGDEAGREASHRHGEVVRPLRLSLEQVYRYRKSPKFDRPSKLRPQLIFFRKMQLTDYNDNCLCQFMYA
jgi:hypothetical protein